MIITTTIDLNLWLDDGNVCVYVDDGEIPAVSVSLTELVTQEILMEAVPASARTLEDIVTISSMEHLGELHTALKESVALIEAALKIHNRTPQHVCGMNGFADAVDPVCPGCEYDREQRAIILSIIEEASP